MRSLLWIVVLTVLVVGLLIPGLYFRAAYKLPTLETVYDLDKLLRPSIEGERRSYAAGLSEKMDPARERYERPDFGRLPKELVALYTTEMGCPTFFQTPREEGVRWGWRLISAMLFNRQPEGDGWCERTLAYRIASALNVTGALERAVAAHKLHRFLQKDQLVAYDLASVRVGKRGVVGVDDISYVLFDKRRPDELNLAELAELSLALPPHRYFETIQTCSNPSLIRRARDKLIGRLARVSLIPTERMRAAQALPVSCAQ
ncbi:MAG TPA: hypothetical protein VK013_01360 [Myxococcaceae bacterium]|nr:hypothetical protein [Myxococcaceae bacterium]